MMSNHGDMLLLNLLFKDHTWVVWSPITKEYLPHILSVNNYYPVLQENNYMQEGLGMDLP